MITRLKLPIRLCLPGLLFILASPALAGTYKCWTNEDGVRECGQSVPPEYSQKRIEILNERGMVIEVEEPAKTPEQLEAEKHAAELRKQEEQREAEQRQRDRILLKTFATERDLRLYYQDKMGAIQSQVDLTMANKDALRQNLDELQKRAANLERRGQQPPDQLLEKMDHTKQKIANNDEIIAHKRQKLEAMNRRFEAELRRFRELTSASSENN